MSQEVYNYVVQSSSATNRISTNVNDNSSFQLQWQNIIPSKYCNNKLF